MGLLMGGNPPRFDKILDQRRCDGCGKSYVENYDPQVFITRFLCPGCRPEPAPRLTLSYGFRKGGK